VIGTQVTSIVAFLNCVAEASDVAQFQWLPLYVDMLVDPLLLLVAASRAVGLLIIISWVCGRVIGNRGVQGIYNIIHTKKCYG